MSSRAKTLPNPAKAGYVAHASDTKPPHAVSEPPSPGSPPPGRCPPRPRRLDLVLPAGAADSAERYRAAFADIFDVEVDPEGFHAHSTRFILSNSVLVHSRMAGQTILRDPAHVRRNGIDDIQVLWYASGDWRGDYDGRSSQGGAGGLRLADTSRPLRHHSSAHELMSLTIPRHAIPGGGNLTAAHGLSLAATSPAARLLAGHLRTLQEVAPALNAAEAASAVAAAGALIGGLLNGMAAPMPEHGAALSRTLLAEAHRLIDAGIADRAISPAAISRRLGVSLRTLYRAFEPSGGIAAAIQIRRLDRAYATIAAMPDHRQSLADIALAHGFVSDAHFSRAFLARFGHRPSELRPRRTPVPPQVIEDAAGTVFNWARTARGR